MTGRAEFSRADKSTGSRQSGILPRRLLIGVLILFLLSPSCNLPGRVSPTPVGTILPENPPTNLPATVPDGGTPTASVPITGMDIELQCQFCVNDEPHAVLILPETAEFNVTGPLARINCLTAQVINGSRVLICRGAPQTSFSLNVCGEDANCAQFPVILETCPISQQAGLGTPPVTVTQPTPATLTPTSIFILPVTPTSATTPPPAQPVTSSPPATSTSTPGIRQPRTGLHDPEGFMRWYFREVWSNRDYRDLWDNYLTSSFKTRPGSGSFEDYASWWDAVERVDVNSVEVIQNDGTHAWVRVNVTFIMKDGRVVDNQEYDYELLYDANRGTWMFDYRS